jgi:hypothetical protein
MSAELTNDIENRFKFHPATDAEKRDAHGSVRNSLRTVAHYLAGVVPPGRERSLMLTHLEEAMFWGNAGLARAQSAAGDEPIDEASRPWPQA